MNNIYRSEYIREISQVGEERWNSLMGNEMTYFQSWHWINLCLKKGVIDNNYRQTLFALVYRDEELILIAPLWILKKNYRYRNKVGCYFTNNLIGWNDYLNFIYKEFDGNAVAFLLKEISDKWMISSFYFNRVLENTQLYQWLKSCKYCIGDDFILSVRLQLPETFDTYSSSLSKNSLHNIRRAKNRLRKDELELRIVLDDTNIDRKKCATLRNIRAQNKKKQQTIPLRAYLKLRSFLYIRSPFWLPLNEDNHGHFLSAYINDELAAFYCYVYSEHNRTVTLLNVGLNERFTRYSPGVLLLYSFIKAKLNGEVSLNFNMIDFTRGVEQYKIALGGTTMPVHHVVLKVL